MNGFDLPDMIIMHDNFIDGFNELERIFNVTIRSMSVSVDCMC